MYRDRDIKGRRKIRKKEYTLTDEDEDAIGLIEESNWMTAIRPGMAISLNMIFPADSNMDFHRCPLCREMTFGKLLAGQRRRWYVNIWIKWAFS